MEKRIWLLEQYAQKAWAVSMDMAGLAASAGAHGRGLSVVAHETRSMAGKLFDYVEQSRFGTDCGDTGAVADCAMQMGFLAVNACIETLYVDAAHSGTYSKSFAVCADEVRRLALEIGALAGKNTPDRPFTLPEPACPVRSTELTDFFFAYSIGGAALVENIAHIQEVCLAPRSIIESGIMKLRGRSIPLVCGLNGDTSGDWLTVLIVCPDSSKRHESCAAVIDELDVNAVFRSKIGLAVPPDAGHPFAEYSRECWQAIGGGQLVFLDWSRLAEAQG